MLPPAPATMACRRFDTSEQLAEAYADLIDTDRYSVVGLSTMCASFHHTLNIIRLLKRRSPSTRIWLGGPQVSVHPQRALEALPEVEAVFVGEGEATLAELLSRGDAAGRPALAGLAGVATREAPFCPRPLLDDLDDLPFADEAAGFLPSLATENVCYLPLEAERGCPGRCTFCSTRLFWRGRVRRKSHARLLLEMQRLHRLTGLTSFYLVGDNFGSPHSLLMEFCQTMRKAAPAFTWCCSLKLDRLRVDDLDALWNGGCRGFFVGVESASQATLDRMRKDVILERELEVIDQAIARGFEVTTSFIVGFPWESQCDMNRTYRLHHSMLKGGAERSVLAALSPLPGSAIEADYHDLIEPYTGLSTTSVDGLPYNHETQAMMDRCPELFTQLGYFRTGAPRDEVAAMVAAARMLSAHYSARKQRERAS